MNVLRTGMNMSISRIHIWLCNISSSFLVGKMLLSRYGDMKKSAVSQTRVKNYQLEILIDEFFAKKLTKL